jgi:hypothetical protein
MNSETRHPPPATRHLEEGQLRAYLDGELAAREAQTHLAGCPDCAARLTTLETQSEQVRHRLAALDRQLDHSMPPRAALARFRERLPRGAKPKETSVFTQLFSKRSRPIWAGLTLVALLALAFSFAPVRAWAGEFLGLFRVQQITVLPIDTTRLGELTNDETLGHQIGQLFSDSITVLREPGDPQAAADAAEASQLAGFNVRLASDHPPAQIVVQGGGAFEFVVDRDQAQAILNEAGRSDLQLPPALDGATIGVDIPTGVTTAYGPCPNLSPTRKGESEEIERGYAVAYPDCMLLAQIPSPSVTTPPDLNAQELAEIGLQFVGMTAEEAHSFSQTVDWTSTLVIPIPRNAASYEEVSVDGVTGSLLHRPFYDDGVPAHYTLLWVKNGIVYALTGFDDPDAGLALANSLP